jgi:aminoglycoside 2'-N-acetyltransferase I
MASSPARKATTTELTSSELSALRGLFDVCWRGPAEEFTEEDWEHTIGGTHFLVEVDGLIVAHASVVERRLHAGEHELRTGYVEAVATLPECRRHGYGTTVVGEANRHIDAHFQLGGLGSGLHRFYRRLGWRLWMGPSYVRTPEGPVRTPEEDGYIYVRLTPTSPPELDLSLPISCEWRPGDVW